MKASFSPLLFGVVARILTMVSIFLNHPIFHLRPSSSTHALTHFIFRFCPYADSFPSSATMLNQPLKHSCFLPLWWSTRTLMVTGLLMTIRSSRARSFALSLVAQAGGFRNDYNDKMEDGCFETPLGTRTTWSLLSWSKERLQDMAERRFSDGVL